MKRFLFVLLLCLPLIPCSAAEPVGVEVPGFGSTEAEQQPDCGGIYQSLIIRDGALIRCLCRVRIR